MIKNLQAVRRKDRVGNKALKIRYLYRKKFRIPKTYILPDAARLGYIKDPDRTEKILKEELKNLLDPAACYAVRSSSDFEDQSGHSFAGQFKTLLNINGPDNILAAVVSVWKSAEHVKESEYFKKVNPQRSSSALGVIIQEMVNPLWSGVAFSINPITGRDEIIVEGVKGPGEGLVQKGENPFRWKYYKGAWEGFDNAGSPGTDLLEYLVKDIQMLRKKCKTQVDVEWVFDGEELYYLQCRAVTSQKYPVIYSNHISREVLPGMIKPLIWSVNIPLVNSAWIRLLEALLGPLDITPDQLSRSFYYRAYFNMGTMGALFHKMGLPKNSLENLMGRKDASGKGAFRPTIKTMLCLPRITWFLISNLNLGRKFERAMVRLRQEIGQLKRKLDEEFSIQQYQYTYTQIMKMAREAAYYNIIIPLAMQIFDRLLRKRMERNKLAYEELDFAADFPRLFDYDPKYNIRRNHELWLNLPAECRESVRRYADLENLPAREDIQVFRKQMDGLINKFGHIGESGNDFSYPPWEEDPDFVLNMVRQGAGDYDDSIRKVAPRCGSAYHRAGRFRLYREMISSEYTRGYGLFRKLFIKTGKHLAATGKISDPQEVFYLTLEEHDQLLQEEDESVIQSLGRVIALRKQEMQDLANISLPSIIYGEEPPLHARPDEKILMGIPTSPGFFEGRIVVVRGYVDFDKKVEGSILVIPFSDVGWTPLLIKAGAIVSESGGMLSHASIVARELSIPAIASVDHACSLEEGIKARLDGYNGLLIIED